MIPALAAAVADDEDRRRAFAVRLGEIARLWRTRIDRRLRPLGLSFLQWTTLRQLAALGDGMVQKELAEAVAIDGPAMVGVLDRLVRAGLVERRTAVHDRRAKTVHLRPRATEVLAEAECALRAVREELLADVDEDALEACLDVFARVLARAEP